MFPGYLFEEAIELTCSIVNSANKTERTVLFYLLVMLCQHQYANVRDLVINGIIHP
jgi:hypothetical protein